MMYLTSSAVAKRRDASCLYSFNTKRRAQLLYQLRIVVLVLVVSASDIPLRTRRTIKFFSVLFGVLVHAAGRHKQTFAGESGLLDQNRDFCLYPTCIRQPHQGGGGSVGISSLRLVWKNQNGWLQTAHDGNSRAYAQHRAAKKRARGQPEDEISMIPSSSSDPAARSYYVPVCQCVAQQAKPPQNCMYTIDLQVE